MGKSVVMSIKKISYKKEKYKKIKGTKDNRIGERMIVKPLPILDNIIVVDNEKKIDYFFREVKKNRKKL